MCCLPDSFQKIERLPHNHGPRPQRDPSFVTASIDTQGVARPQWQHPVTVVYVEPGRARVRCSERLVRDCILDPPVQHRLLRCPCLFDKTRRGRGTRRFRAWKCQRDPRAGADRASRAYRGQTIKGRAHPPDTGAQQNTLRWWTSLFRHRGGCEESFRGLRDDHFSEIPWYVLYTLARMCC